MTTTTTIATATFTKLPDGSWGIQGEGLVKGQPVVIRKQSGETKQAVVGDIVDLNRWGKTVAYIARPERHAPANPVTEPGFYLHDGQAYKVIESRDGEFLYARLVTGHGLQKAPGVFAKLTPANKMTPAQIAAYGVRTQVCVNCSTALTDPASQRVGLGTKCGPDILGNDVYRAAYKAAKAEVEVAKAQADAAAEHDAEADAVADLLAHFGA